HQPRRIPPSRPHHRLHHMQHARAAQLLGRRQRRPRRRRRLRRVQAPEMHHPPTPRMPVAKRLLQHARKILLPPHRHLVRVRAHLPIRRPRPHPHASLAPRLQQRLHRRPRPAPIAQHHPASPPPCPFLAPPQLLRPPLHLVEP